MATLSTPISPLYRRYWPPLVLCGLLLTISFGAWAVDDQLLTRTVIESLVDVTLVVGIYIFVGNSGIISFGHVGFMAIGAYAAAWQTVRILIKPSIMPGLPEFLLNTTVPALPATILSAGLAALVALVVGFIVLRLSGLGASIATFAFLGIVNATYSNWERVTGGTSSIVGIPVYVDVWVALAWAFVTIVAAFVFQSSRHGVMLRSSREDEVAARACGVSVFPQRLLAFVISGFFVGLGGDLYAHYLGAVFIDSFYLGRTFILLAMLVAGGMQSLTGAVVGALLISAIQAALRELEKGIVLAGASISIPSGAQEIGLGILIIFVLIVRRKGLTNGLEARWPDFREIARLLKPFIRGVRP